MDPHLRQKFLNPITLRTAQVFFDVCRWPRFTASGRRFPAPFFIIGSGRSGTTLLRSILQGHPKLHIPPESNGRIPNVVKKFYRYGGLDWQDLVHVLLGEFTGHDNFEFWDLKIRNLQQELLKLSGHDRNLQQIIHTIYHCHMHTHKPGAIRWGDKSPFNTLRLNWIRKAFPLAQYIEIIRDGRDVVNSSLKNRLQPDVKTAADHWKLSLLRAEDLRKKVEPGNYMRIHYEDLVQHPAELASELCHFLNVNFIEDILKKRKTEFNEQVLPHMRTVAEKINTKSLGLWNKELQETDKEFLNDYLNELLTLYGYNNK